MPVTDVEKSAAELKMVVTAEFDAPVDNVWRLWTEASLFERWWSPPGFSIISEEHNIVPGGRIGFFFVSADGDKIPMEWEVLEVDAPRRLVLRDADVDENGEPNDGNGLSALEITLAPAGDRSRMVVTTRFNSLEGMEEAVAVGFFEGLQHNLRQAEAVLADLPAA